MVVQCRITGRAQEGADVGSVERIIGSLLSALHGAVRPPVCRNDWLSTISELGFILAALPVLAAILIALTRKWTGNRYTIGIGSAFGLLGVVFCFALPWLAFRGASDVFRHVRVYGAGRGLSAANVLSVHRRSCIVDNQPEYLGGRTVYQVLTHPLHGTTGFWSYPVLLIGGPLVGVFVIMLQSRIALRRGQKWPGRFLWVPFVGLAFATAPLRAGTVGQLWIGFVAGSIVGLLLVLLAGKPRWSVINNSGKDRAPQQPPPYQPPAYRPPPPEPQPVYDPPPPARDPVLERALPYGKAAETRQLTEKPLATEHIAGTNGRFQRVRTLGSGGFGTVWLAMDTHLDRTVAVKFAHAPDADTEQRIRREAKALAAVRHPNCVRIYDIVAEPDGLGIVMEYIDGPLLADVVKNNKTLDDVAAARLWLTMAGALSAAHGEGVLHRDVKPSNVIVDIRGVPHLIDFGIARSAGDKTLTSTGMMVGTPDYLAPEIARNGPPTPAADCWQLAATVGFALTGNPPRGRRPDLMAAMVAAAAFDPCTELPENSVHIRLLRAALDNDPAKRPSLATIRTQISGWLARSGHVEDGPIVTTEVIPEISGTRPIPR
jgi:predicted Ser/Thr protein kinase